MREYSVAIKDGEREEIVGPTEEGITIGRSRKANIKVSDQMVSGVHARIRKTTKGILLEDLDSKNGVFVNDKKIEEHLLKEGDVAAIGTVQLRLSDVIVLPTISNIDLSVVMPNPMKRPKKEPQAKRPPRNLVSRIKRLIKKE